MVTFDHECKENSRRPLVESSTKHKAKRNHELHKLRNKQQRLLLLRHATRCKYGEGCPVTPHCASMKELWKHIAHCKDNECSVRHCRSSRYILSHHRNCNNPKCPACGPLRATIRKSRENERIKGNNKKTAISSSEMDAANGKRYNKISSGYDNTTADPPASLTGLMPSDFDEPKAKRSKIERSSESVYGKHDTHHPSSLAPPTTPPFALPTSVANSAPTAPPYLHMSHPEFYFGAPPPCLPLPPPTSVPPLSVVQPASAVRPSTPSTSTDFNAETG